MLANGGRRSVPDHSSKRGVSYGGRRGVMYGDVIGCRGDVSYGCVIRVRRGVVRDGTVAKGGGVSDGVEVGGKRGEGGKGGIVHGCVVFDGESLALIAEANMVEEIDKVEKI